MNIEEIKKLPQKWRGLDDGKWHGIIGNTEDDIYKKCADELELILKSNENQDSTKPDKLLHRIIGLE